MAYYWRARNIPELREVQVEDRREWLRVAREHVWRGWVRWVCVAAGALGYAGAKEIDDRLHMNLFAGLLVVLAAVGVVAWSFEAFWLQPRARQWLREHLHEFRTNDDAEPTGVTRS